MQRKIKMGMIGGGAGAFIGAVHRMAANLDGQIELVCGAFSSNPEKSRKTGEELYLDESRIYPDYKTMIETECKLPEGQRMDFVAIVTPNHVHYEPAKLAMERSFHVMMDKPLCLSLNEAYKLEKLVSDKNVLFGLTHTYTGYPLIKHARFLCQQNALGTIRKIYVEYPQGWLTKNVEKEKQAVWRTDPNRSGKSGAMGDIGTHAANMVEFVTGQQIELVSASLNTVGKGRTIDDDGTVLFKLKNGATGVLTASQIAAGEENDLKIRVYGEKAGIEWTHSDPNSLKIKWLEKPMETLRTGSEKNLCAPALKNIRLPSGHPEGFIEAFANLYKNFAHQIQARLNNTSPDPDLLDVPSVSDGVRGMLFIDKIVESSNIDGKWIRMD